MKTGNPGVSREDGFILLFQLGGTVFGIPLEQVLEVIVPPAVVRLPGDPILAEGIIGYRGDAFTIIRLSRLLEAEPVLERGAGDEGGRSIGRPDSAGIGFHYRRTAPTEGKSEADGKVILLSPTPVFGGMMRIGLRVERLRGVFRREEGKAGVVSEAGGKTARAGSIVGESLEFKDQRGETIRAGILNLAALKDRVMKGLTIDE